MSKALPTTPATPDRSDGGRCAWFSDTQINLCGPYHSWISRTIYEITSPDGVQASGSLDLDYDPVFQTLVIYHVRVIREGVTRDVDVRAGLQELRRERDLERAMFDGRLTAHMTIPDIRVGDIVDICHGVIGSPPILNGRFSAEWRLNWGCWVGETRVRLVAPAERRLTIEGWNDPPKCETTKLSSGDVLRTWRTQNTTPATFEGGAPSWIRPYVSVRVSDAMSWNDVADAFRGFYAAQAMPPTLEAAAQEIEAAVRSPAERAVAALRLVQGDLRYQAVTIGDGGFVPRPIEQVWASRTGDCKDASYLLTALLRRLGISADPVLVNTFGGKILKDAAPSLTSFDHCIVGMTLDGRRYWLDPTLFPQGGRLDVLRQPRYGWALPLVAGASLESMGDDPLADSLSTKEVYELPIEVDGPGRLKIETTYHGWRADLMRRRIAGGVANLTRDLLGDCERRFGSVTSVEPLGIEDNLADNRLTVREAYQTSRIWEKAPDGERVVFEPLDELFRPYLPGIPREGRRWPIELGMPLRATSIIEIHAPIPTPATEWDDVIEMKGLRATSKLMNVDGARKVLRLQRSLCFQRTVLQPDEALAYANFREKVLHGASVGVRQPFKFGQLIVPKASRKKPGLLQWIWWFFVAIWVLGTLSRLLAQA